MSDSVTVAPIVASTVRQTYCHIKSKRPTETIVFFYRLVEIKTKHNSTVQFRKKGLSPKQTLKSSGRRQRVINDEDFYLILQPPFPFILLQVLSATNVTNVQNLMKIRNVQFQKS